MQKIGVVWGHPRSSATQPFDRAHTTSYSTLTETMHLSCTIFELQRIFSSKEADVNPPNLYLLPPYGVIQFKFRRDIWHQKPKVPGYIRHY